MGARAGGRLVGCTAAILLAASPVFLLQSLLPMSDVPATAWWALSLACALGSARTAPLCCGIAGGLAILTRPNLVPLAVIPPVLLLWPLLRTPAAGAEMARRLALFSAGVVPACLAIAFLNNRWYGSPFAAGYGTVDQLYSAVNLIPNLERYPRWLLRTETPIVLLGLGAPIVARRERRFGVAGFCFVAIVLASYLFHFPNDGWVWLRYLLPALPALLVLTGITIAVALRGLERGVRIAAAATIVLLVAGHGLGFTAREGVFGVDQGERKSRAMGEYIAHRFADRSVFISNLHSGSIRYYADRLTVRSEFIPDQFLDRVITDLRELGYRPYIVLEQQEEARFRQQFSSRSGYGALDWPPAVVLDHSTTVRIYDPAQRDAAPEDRPATTIVR
jgi:hypothetical protein